MAFVYNVTVEETIVGNFEIEANSPEKAFEIACEKYRKGKLVNEPGEVHATKICVRNEAKDLEIDFAEI